MQNSSSVGLAPILLASVALATCHVASAQDLHVLQRVGEPPASAPAGARPVLDNDGIIQLQRLGLGPDVILESLESSTPRFDVSPAGLARLKSEGVPDAVLAAMIRKTRVAADAFAESMGEVSNDPMAPHAPGIYVLQDHDGEPRMSRIEASAFSQRKTGGFLASQFSFGLAKIKGKGVLTSERSATRISDPDPVFYFYFDVKESSLSNSAFSAVVNATSPNEFALVEVEQKAGGREVVIFQANALGSQQGTLSKLVRPFRFEALRAGAYAVRPEPRLGAGEYCFYMSGAATGGSVAKVFDFGIDASGPDPVVVAESTLTPADEPAPSGDGEERNVADHGGHARAPAGPAEEPAPRRRLPR